MNFVNKLPTEICLVETSEVYTCHNANFPVLSRAIFRSNLLGRYSEKLQQFVTQTFCSFTVRVLCFEPKTDLIHRVFPHYDKYSINTDIKKLDDKIQLPKYVSQSHLFNIRMELIRRSIFNKKYSNINFHHHMQNESHSMVFQGIS